MKKKSILLTLSTENEMLLVSKYENEMLELIYGMEDLTTSDLQGCIGSILLRLHRESKTK